MSEVKEMAEKIREMSTPAPATDAPEETVNYAGTDAATGEAVAEVPAGASFCVVCHNPEGKEIADTKSEPLKHSEAVEYCKELNAGEKDGNWWGVVPK